MMKYDLVIIGGGPAGMAAAVGAYESGERNILILDREHAAGGILSQCIHNGFGLHKFGEELTGPEYAHLYLQKVREYNITILQETMVIDLSENKVITAQNSLYGVFSIAAKAVVLAMGCRERSRGALNICGTRPAGIYTAGTAQKLINQMGYTVGRKAVILGSGDIGLIMARRLTLEGIQVEAVCEIMPYSGGLTRNIVQCLEDFQIPLFMRHTIAAVHGEKRVEGVTIAEVDEQNQPIPSTMRYIACDTVLLSVGLIPENELTAKANIRIDPVTKGARVDERRQTSVEGVFACGNVLHVHDLVDFVSDEAELAGRSAAAYIQGKTSGSATVDTVAGNNVRYVLPQKIHANYEEDIVLFFRVTKPMGSVVIRALCCGRILTTIKRKRAVPGEMERIVLTAKLLSTINGNITIEVEELL